MQNNPLQQALWATMSPDATIRHAAEEFLNNARKQPQFIEEISKLASSAEDSTLKLSAAVLLKNHLRGFWRARKAWDFELSQWEDRKNKGLTEAEIGEKPVFESPIPLSDEGRVIVRNLLVTSLASPLPSQARKVFTFCVSEAIQCDWPRYWPDLMPSLKQHLSAADNIHLLQGMLLLLRAMTKKYEYAAEARRSHLWEVAADFFPQLLNLLDELAKHESVDTAEISVTVLKIFWSSVRTYLPPVLFDAAHFERWMFHILRILDQPMIGTPEQIQDLQHPQWRAKKRCLSILQGFIEHYTNEKLQADEKYIQFAKIMKAKYVHVTVVAIIKVFQLTQPLLPGQRIGFLPERVSSLAFQALTECVPLAATYKALKPHLEFVLTHAIFHFLQFDVQNDMDDWTHDPLEYIRRTFDVEAEFYHPRPAASSLLDDLCSTRKQNLNPFVMFCFSLLKKYEETADRTNVLLAAEKDGVMLGLGVLAQKLQKSKTFKAQLEPMIVRFVAPELQSPIGFLRARACWTICKFCMIDFQNEQTFIELMKATMNCLSDPELPVRVEAARAVGSFVARESSIDLLRPILSDVFREFFKLISEVGLDELLMTVYRITEVFSEEIGQYALELCQQMVTSFLQIAGNAPDIKIDEVNGDISVSIVGAGAGVSESTQDEYVTSSLASMECLRVIVSVLASITEQPQIITQLEPVLQPLLFKSLTNSAVISDFFEELMVILGYITLYGPEISDMMWSLYPHIFNALQLDAFDYIADAIPALDNYISRGTEVFLAHDDLVNQACQLIEKLLSDPNQSEMAQLQGLSLIESIVHSCKGKINKLIPPFLTLLTPLSKNAEYGPMTKIIISDVFVDLIYYDARLFFEVVGQSASDLHHILAYVFDQTPQLRRILDKKLHVLGFCAVLALPADFISGVLPQGGEGVRKLVETTVSLVLAIQQQKGENEKKRQIAMAKAEEEEEEEEDEDHEFDEDEDLFNEQGLTYLRQLSEYAEFDEDDDEYDSDEEEMYVSAVTDIDEEQLVLDTITQFLKASGRASGSLDDVAAVFGPGIASAVNNISACVMSRK